MNKSLGCTGRGHSFGLLNLLQYLFHITTFKIFSLLSNSGNLGNLMAVPFILWFVSLSNCQLFTKGGHTIHKDKGIETL